MYQYHIIGQVTYLLFCPKAPGVDACNPVSGCPGHHFPGPIDMHLDAPDEARAASAALKKVAAIYPWPLWDPTTLQVDVVVPPILEPPTRASAPLPGFEDAISPPRPMSRFPYPTR